MSSSSLPIEAILAVSLDAAVAMRANGTIAGWNGQAERTFGWSSAEAEGRLLCELIIPEQYRAAHRVGLERYLATGEGPVLDQRIEISALHRDGRELPVELSITALNNGGQPLFLGYLRDISERKQAELALRESEARLRLALDGAKLGTWDWDLRTLRGSWSPRTMEILGVDSGEDITPEQRGETIHPEDRERVWAEIADAIRSGREMISEYRVVRPDGQVRWIVSRGAVERDEAGVPVRASGVVFDVTGRIEAELRLRESEARLGATYHHALVGIAETDPTGRYVRANEEFCRITGYTADELTTISFVDLTHPSDVAADRELYARQWAGEIDTYSLEKRYVRKDGSIIWVELAASIVRGESGGPSFGVRIVRDITERRRAEAHQRLLLNELNHRVKNTLAVVQGIAQQSFRQGTPMPDARAAFEGRLAALSAAHNILTRENWEAASLEEIVEGSIAPHGASDGRFVVEGPDIRLAPKTAVSLALALHELGTNAAKYGALSVPDGKVEIRWRVSDGRLHLVWLERGGPEVAPPTSRGFGTRMIERGLAAELGGNVTIDFDRHGVVCTIDAPVPDVRKSV